MNIFKKIVIFSVVETVALVLWKALTKSLAKVAFGILALGLSIEHWFSFNTNHGRKLTETAGVPFKKIIGFSLSESILWVLWLLIIQAIGGTVGFVTGAIFLTITLVPQHKIELNVMEGKPLFEDLLSQRVLGISVIEAVGSTVWLALIPVNPILAIVVLLVTMIIEHVVQANEIHLS